jgi:hypothetical protein
MDENVSIAYAGIISRKHDLIDSLREYCSAVDNKHSWYKDANFTDFEDKLGKLIIETTCKIHKK